MPIHKHALLLVLCLLAGACQQTIAPDTELASTTQRSELEGSHWQLVIIQSMDDSQYTPAGPQDFSLTFEPGGKLLVQSDCNRGVGSWTSTQPGQLTFSPIALTRMACRPGSIDGRFNQDVAYVRSYVLNGDNLYLATMADGSILEFETYAKPAFDCALASNSIESLICEDADLTQLDLRLDKLFSTALKTNPETETLRAYQRGWIKGRDDCWKASDVRDCVVNEYQRRITELEIETAATAVPSPVTFSCQDESRISVYFYPDTEKPAAVINRATEQRLLYLVRSASGARYSGPNVDFWNKGDAAQLTWGSTETTCQQE